VFDEVEAVSALVDWDAFVTARWEERPSSRFSSEESE